MRRFIVRVLAIIGGSVVLMMVASVISLTMLYRATGGERIPDKTVLEINFEQDFIEYSKEDSVDRKSTRLNSSHLKLSRMPSSA